MHVRRIGPALAMVALVAAVATGCSSSGDAPGVATAGGNAAAGPTPSTGAAGDGSEQLRQFAQCMRDHGVNVSDPQPDGSMIDSVNKNDPNAQAAFNACKSKLPHGGQALKLKPDQIEQYRGFAQCMRDNGVDTADPAADGTLPLRQAGVRRDDPAFQKAFEACRDKLAGVVPSGGPGRIGDTS